MASSINASTSGAGGVITTADNTGILNLQTASTTAVTIDASQNVGIGTASPIAKLDVRGAGAYFYDNSTTDFQLTVASSVSTIGTTTATPLAFKSNSTERMRIDSSGNVLIGTTTSSAKNYIYNNITQFGIGIEHTTASYAALMVANTASSGTRYLVDFRVSGTAGGNQQGTITSTGTNVAYNTSSDYRLKENVTAITNALDKVSQLKPVNWTWKIDGSNGQGFIAHELQAVCPQAVAGEKDAVDEKGNPVYQGVDTSFLVATLTAAIQEQQTIINDLKARVTALEAK